MRKTNGDTGETGVGTGGSDSDGDSDSRYGSGFDSDPDADAETDPDPFDRVRTVMRQTVRPKTAEDVSVLAGTSEDDARRHLDRLVGLGVAERLVDHPDAEDGDAPVYRRDADWDLSRRIADLRSDTTTEEIELLVETMMDEVHGYRDEYGVETPDELLVELDPADDRDDWLTLSAWENTERHLAVARAALSFDEAADALSGR